MSLKVIYCLWVCFGLKHFDSSLSLLLLFYVETRMSVEKKCTAEANVNMRENVAIKTHRTRLHPTLKNQSWDKTVWGILGFFFSF